MFRGFVFDIDGTLLRGRTILPGVAETLLELRRRGFPVVLLTNDTQETPRAWVARLGAVGLSFAEADVVTAAVVAADVLAERFPGAKIFAVGDPALIEALTARHLTLLDGLSADRADVVLLGEDSQFDAQKLHLICKHIWAGAAFYATNADRRRPAQNGYTPGTGGYVQAVSFVTEVEAIVTGKPSLTAAEVALRRLGLAAPEVVMVGDAPISDISMGRAAGMTTVLVPSDGKTRQDPMLLPAEQRPHAALANMQELIAWLDQGQ